MTFRKTCLEPIASGMRKRCSNAWISKLGTGALAIILAVAISGCGRPVYNVFNSALQPTTPKLEETLQVSVTLSIFSGLLSVQNVSAESITVRRVTINGKYIADHWPTPMGGRGEKFETTQLESGRGIMLWLSPEWPRPINVSIETDRGTLNTKMKYEG